MKIVLFLAIYISVGLTGLVAQEYLDGVTVTTLIRPKTVFTDDIVIDKEGNLYANDALGTGTIKEPKGKSIFKITPDLKVDTFKTGFNLPLGNFIDQEGNIYVCSYLAGSIDKINTKGELSRLVSGVQGVCDVVVDSKENVFASFSGANLIIKVTPDKQISRYVEGEPLNIPIGMTIDESDNIYVSGFRNGKIHKISNTDSTDIELIATIKNSNPAEGCIGFIKYHDGVLYVPGYATAKVYMVDLKSNELLIVAGTGEKGTVDGNGKEALFTNPNGIAVSSDGKTLFITDDYDFTLRKITLDK